MRSGLARVVRLLPPAVCGLALSLTTSSPSSIDPPAPRWSPPLAVRKTPDSSLPSDPAAPMTTLGSLVSLHFDEIEPLSDDEPSPEAFAAITRDRVTGQQTQMAPELLTLVRAIAAGRAPARVEIISGYRSWKLNEMLRKKEHHVAEHSQHSLGHAMDFRFEGLSSKDLAHRIEKAGWNGGLAFYPGDTDRFVHADVGPKRRWRGR